MGEPGQEGQGSAWRKQKNDVGCLRIKVLKEKWKNWGNLVQKEGNRGKTGLC